MGTSPVNNWHSSCPFQHHHIQIILMHLSLLRVRSAPNPALNLLRAHRHTAQLCSRKIHSYCMLSHPFPSQKKNYICISWGKHQCLQGRIVLKFKISLNFRLWCSVNEMCIVHICFLLINARETCPSFFFGFEKENLKRSPARPCNGNE